MKTNKILLNGYIGYGNFGDDLLFELAISKVQKLSNIEVSVVIINPNITPDYLYNYYPKLNIIRLNNKIPLLFYKKFDKVYYIGGGILFDYKSSLSNKYFYKKYISNLIRYKIPKLFGTRFGGIGIGIGPYFCEKTKKIHAQIINNFDLLGVRDRTSFDEAKLMGYDDVILSNDLSLGLNESIQKINYLEKNNEIIICPRTYSHKQEYEKHIEELIIFAEYLENNNYKTHWIFLQKDDKHLTNRLKSKFKVTIWNPIDMSILDFIKFFKNGLVTYTSRMHSIFISGMVNTPIVAITLHQKLIYASELFYNDPILIKPLAKQEEYFNSFKNIKSKPFSKEKFNKEMNILKEIDKKVSVWLTD